MADSSQPLAPGGKPAIQSLAVIAGVVSFGCAAVGLAGYAINADDQTKLLELVQNGYAVYLTVAGMVSSALALWGRIRATKQITGVVSTK